MSINGLKNDIHKEPDELEREADRARQDVERTLEDLQRSLSPGQLVDETLGMLRQSGGDFGRNLSTQVRNNPMSAVLTGVGIAWMMAASKRPPQAYGASAERVSAGAHRVSEGTRSAVRGTKDAMHNVSESTRQAASDVAAKAREAGSSVSSATRSTMDSMTDASRRARLQYERMQREQPLVLGALAVAAGAALGAMLPRTRAEDEWVGDVSDDTTDRLKRAGHRKAEELEETAARAAKAAGRAAEKDLDGAGESRGPGSSSYSSSGSTAGSGSTVGSTSPTGGSASPGSSSSSSKGQPSRP